MPHSQPGPFPPLPGSTEPPFRTPRCGWHCWHPAPSSTGREVLCGETKQAVLGLFASLAAHCHALLAAARLSKLMGTREA